MSYSPAAVHFVTSHAADQPHNTIFQLNCWERHLREPHPVVFARESTASPPLPLKKHALLASSRLAALCVPCSSVLSTMLDIETSEIALPSPSTYTPPPPFFSKSDIQRTGKSTLNQGGLRVFCTASSQTNKCVSRPSMKGAFIPLGHSHKNLAFLCWVNRSEGPILFFTLGSGSAR